MGTDGPRVAMLSAIGVPIAIVAARYLPDDAPGYHDDIRFAVAFVVAGGLSAVVWLAVSSRQVDRDTSLAMGVAGLAAVGLSLSAPHANLMRAVLAGIFWWFAGALLVLPAGQAIRAIQRARYAIRQAPYGEGASGIDSQQ